MSNDILLPRTITVTVYSDLACPWCYVGQRRLRRAIEQFEQEQQQRYSTQDDRIQIQVIWKPYQIDPNTNIDGEEFEAYNRRRWGSSGWTTHLRHEGKLDGALFHNWLWWPNTLRAHQWIQYGLDNTSYTSDQLNNI